jgi:hypothetical protein
MISRHHAIMPRAHTSSSQLHATSAISRGTTLGCHRSIGFPPRRSRGITEHSRAASADHHRDTRTHRDVTLTPRAPIGYPIGDAAIAS